MGILVLAKPVHHTHPTVQQLNGGASVAVIPAGSLSSAGIPKGKQSSRGWMDVRGQRSVHSQASS